MVTFNKIFLYFSTGFLIAFGVFLFAPPALAADSFSLQIFNNYSLSGNPISTQTVSTIDLSSLPARSSARWTGTINVPQGAVYQFFAETQDGMRIRIDGSQVFSRWVQQNLWSAFTVSLTAGNHSIQVDYYQYDATGHANVIWRPLAAARTDVPAPVTNPTPTPTPTPSPVPTPTPTPVPPTPTPTTKTAVVFITGLNEDPIQPQITSRYLAQLPAGTPWLILSFNDSNLVGKINALYPNNNIVLVGHSFGGNAAVNASTALGARVNLLLLLDPVHIATPSIPSDFTIPSTVKKAIDERRQYVVSGIPPASGLIANPRPQDQNIIYPETGCNPSDPNYAWCGHSLPVYFSSNYSFIKAAL